MEEIKGPYRNPKEDDIAKLLKELDCDYGSEKEAIKKVKELKGIINCALKFRSSICNAAGMVEETSDSHLQNNIRLFRSQLDNYKRTYRMEERSFREAITFFLVISSLASAVALIVTSIYAGLTFIGEPGASRILATTVGPTIISVIAASIFAYTYAKIRRG